MKRLLSLRFCLLVALLICAVPTPSWSCPQCRPLVQKGIYNASFAPNLFEVMLPILVLFSLVMAWHLAPRFARSAE